MEKRIKPKTNKNARKSYVHQNKIIYWRGLYETYKRHYATWPNSFWANKRELAANELIKLGYTPS